MKFDPYSWQEFDNDQQVNAPKGRLRVRCSQPAALYIEAQGYEALADYGTAFEIDVSEAVMWRIDGPEGTRAFVYRPRDTSTVAKGEVFTNIDRMPHESGQMVEVQRALRQFEIERRAALREIRAEQASLRALRDQVTTPPPPPVSSQQDPGPEVEAGGENEAEADE